MDKAGCIDFRSLHALWRLIQARWGQPIDFFGPRFQSGTREQRNYRERRFIEHFFECEQCRSSVVARPILGFENTVQIELITLPK